MYYKIIHKSNMMCIPLHFKHVIKICNYINQVKHLSNAFWTHLCALEVDLGLQIAPPLVRKIDENIDIYICRETERDYEYIIYVYTMYISYNHIYIHHSQLPS